MLDLKKNSLMIDDIKIISVNISGWWQQLVFILLRNLFELCAAYNKAIILIFIFFREVSSVSY